MESNRGALALRTWRRASAGVSLDTRQCGRKGVFHLEMELPNSLICSLAIADECLFDKLVKKLVK